MRRHICLCALAVAAACGGLPPAPTSAQGGPDVAAAIEVARLAVAMARAESVMQGDDVRVVATAPEARRVAAALEQALAAPAVRGTSTEIEAQLISAALDEVMFEADEHAEAAPAPPPGGTRTLRRATEAPVLPERTIVRRRAQAALPVRRIRHVGAEPPASTWASPIRDGRVTSRFGPRIDPITGERGRMHRGIDYGAPTGTPVLATAPGSVVLAGWCSAGTGNCVVIDHGDGWRSQYFHLSRVSVETGDEVERGQRVGAVGSTGRSTGPHLHFQMGRHGVALDPYPLLHGRGR
jgi:murein DD-endopeptidase MepM/ murein hydrolase activator NlpD